MSAIGAVWHLDGRPVAHGLMADMMEAVAYRGPDAGGSWYGGHVALGRRLLATTPEAKWERQPFVLGPFAMVFDGRLDNRDELGDALGLYSRSCGDAELALRAYARWGLDMPSRLLGDFALALWDGLEERLVCARDPLGIKVLHYAFDGGTWVCGSEIKQVLAYTRAGRRFNPRQLGLFLSLRRHD